MWPLRLWHAPMWRRRHGAARAHGHGRRGNTRGACSWVVQRHSTGGQHGASRHHGLHGVVHDHHVRAHGHVRRHHATCLLHSHHLHVHVHLLHLHLLLLVLLMASRTSTLSAHTPTTLMRGWATRHGEARLRHVAWLWHN